MAKSDVDSKSYKQFTKKSELDKAVHTLVGIIKGINADNKITHIEMEELIHWCNLHRQFINKHPFNELIPLIEKSLEDRDLTNEEIEDILWVCNNFENTSEYYDIITSDLQKLQGILHGILADNEINDIEVKSLKTWLEDNDHLVKTYPYDELYSLIVSVLKDGKVDDDERAMLKVYFSEFVDLKNSYNLNEFEIEELKKTIKLEGICALCPEISIEGSMFCFTGTSSKTTRSKIADLITSLGGNFHDSVTKNTNYLVIGNDGNPCWAFSCYGRKVEKAIKLRKEGVKLVIVHENDFWDSVEDLGLDVTVEIAADKKDGNSTNVITDNPDVQLF